MKRSDLATVCAIAIVAYAADDVVHEVVGHYLTSQLVPGVRIVSLSTVALQTAGKSRLVAACGTIANLFAGAVVLLLLRRNAKTIATQFFLWLFAVVNLMNGTGYLLFSGVLNTGDWAAVIAGLQPHWAWRFGLSLLGLVGYVVVVSLAADALSRLLDRGLDRSEVQRLVYAAYISGGLLFVAGAALNPISPMLILTSGVSTAFGGTAGLLFVPGIVERMRAQSDGTDSLARDQRWIFAGALMGIAFVGVLGPGVRF